MTDEQIALARRAVACRGWRWMPGMRWTNDPAKPLPSDGDEGRYEYGYTPPKYGIPDLQDSATLGCLLALVREAWVYPSAQVAPMFTAGAGWLAYTHDDGDRDHRFYGASEAEALVAALEAAP